MNSSFPSGLFLISLDFELYWGVRDKRSLESYAWNLRNTREAVLSLLELFREYGIHATWSTVGFLFFSSPDSLKAVLPAQQPRYKDPNLCPYRYFDSNAYLEPEVHFAPDLIELIGKSPGQEVGTHTFSHFYCLEEGISEASFDADLVAAQRAGKESGLLPKSLVFPRNQWREDFLPLLPKHGIHCFRGVESHPIYSASANSEQGLARRALRLLDCYLNLTGHHCFGPESTGDSLPYNLPASRFLRPHSSKLSLLDGLKRRRIVKAMRVAATENKAFHLWWHPHNFGKHLTENIGFLSTILEEYRHLSESHGMRSVNMSEMANELRNGET